MTHAENLKHKSFNRSSPKKTEVKLKLYNFTNEVAASHFHTCGLLDADMGYKINKTWEAGLSARNLLNHTTCSVTQHSGFNTFASSLPLRGREVLIRLLYRL
ncbi:MAG: TonB-dependent receptor [Prevotella sp.]|nr:TonB-dependent receptor [Prevotella sp.]